MKEIIQFFVAIFLGVFITLAFLSNNPCIINVLISMFLDNSVKQLDEIKS